MVAFTARSVTRTPVWHDNKALFVQSLEEEPESYHLHIIIAVVFAKAGQPAQAESEYLIARRIYKKAAAAYSGGAEAALIDKDPARAAALLDTVIARSPGDYYGYMRLAEVREIMEDWTGALAVAKKAVALAPDSVRVVDALAVAAAHLKDYDSADSAYRHALTDLPNNRHIRREYAEMLRARGDTAGARRVAEPLRAQVGL
jgi:tetratricopeptide (TPR) repeat protein